VKAVPIMAFRPSRHGAPRAFDCATPARTGKGAQRTRDARDRATLSGTAGPAPGRPLSLRVAREAEHADAEDAAPM
jgi:hypothetical protein